MKADQGLRWRLGLAVACSCWLLGPVSSISAATFDELYTVSVAPESEARDPRADAIRRGMSLLLTRITGRQQASAYPAMQELIDDAARYLDVYAPAADQIRVGFIPTQVNQALTRLNMPIWGQERPLTLLWVAAEFENGQRAELRALESAGALPRTSRVARVNDIAGVPSEPLSDEDAEFFVGIAREILTAADERGLPIVLPRLDADDRRLVRFADVWGGFEPIVARAAERYGVDAIIIARISNSEFGPEVKWSVQRGDRWQTLTGPRVREGVDWLANEFASEYTTIGDARMTRITVQGIRRWPDYRVKEYLESISIVESVNVESFEAGEFVLRVTARGDDDQLDRLLTLDGQLLPVESGSGLVYTPSWVLNSEQIVTP